MPEPQLSVRSAKARETGREPDAAFYRRLAVDHGENIELEAVIRADRRINPGPDL